MLRRSFAPTLVLALLLVGCGGHSSSPSTAPAASVEAKAVVTQTLTDFLSTTNYQLDGPMRFSDIDFAIGGIDAAEPPNVNDPLIGVPEDPLPTAYQNDGLGLWENLPNGDYSREDFYTDGTMTQTAGFCTETTGGSDAASTDAFHFEITAGPYAGAHGDSSATFQDGPKGDGSDDLWHQTYAYTAADGTVYAGTFDYKGLAYTATATTTLPDGTKSTLTAAIGENDKGTVTFVSHKGVTLAAKFTDNGEATGTLKGDGVGLPAQFSFAPEKGKDFAVRFSDGSVATFGGGDATTRLKRAKAIGSAARRRARLRALLKH